MGRMGLTILLLGPAFAGEVAHLATIVACTMGCCVLALTRSRTTVASATMASPSTATIAVIAMSS
jgi:hypothetical protein